jgi:hypothetical protein
VPVVAEVVIVLEALDYLFRRESAQGVHETRQRLERGRIPAVGISQDRVPAGGAAFAMCGEVVTQEIGTRHGTGVGEHQHRRSRQPGSGVTGRAGAEPEILLEGVLHSQPAGERLRYGLRVVR